MQNKGESPIERFPDPFGECEKYEAWFGRVGSANWQEISQKGFYALLSWHGSSDNTYSKDGRLLASNVDVRSIRRVLYWPLDWKSILVLIYRHSETYYQYEKPFDPSEFVHFRKRLFTDRAEKLLKLSISLYEKNEIDEKEVLNDTTVRVKNIHIQQTPSFIRRS